MSSRASVRSQVSQLDREHNARGRWKGKKIGKEVQTFKSREESAPRLYVIVKINCVCVENQGLMCSLPLTA